MLLLATGKDYTIILKIGQQNPGKALENFISAYFKSDFQIPHAKIYQNTNFQLTSSSESKVSLRLLLHKCCKEITKINIIWYSSSCDLYSLPTLKNNSKQMLVKVFSFYMYKMNLLSFLSFQLLPLAMWNVYPRISEMGNKIQL